MQTIQIKSRHSSLESAVAAANMDLSYNAALAASNIKDTDRNCSQAFVTENDEVMFVFECDIPILHKFSPFHSCLDNSPFSIAFLGKLTIHISDPLFQKTKEGRKSVSTMIKNISAEHKIEAFAF